jgi:hypothetical protein
MTLASRQPNGWSLWPLSPYAQLALSLALAFALRLAFLVSAQGMINGDEAVLGIQAERILRGQFPIYFDGQAYMGTWDAYLAAPLIGLFGPSAWILHGITMVESLFLVPLLGALATRLYGERARLPALLLAACVPLFALADELRALGGYVETLVLGTALMLLTVSIAERWNSDRSTLWAWLLVGFLTGFALWIDPLIVHFLVICAVWIIPVALARICHSWRHGIAWAPSFSLRAFVSVLAFIAGAAPAIHYALQNEGANYQFILSGTRATGLRLDVLQYMLTVAFPHVIGVANPWAPQHGSIHTALSVLSYLVLTVVILALGWAFALIIRRAPGKGGHWFAFGDMASSRWWRYALAPLAFLVTCFIYWRSPAVGIFVGLTNSDRYLLPITIPVTLMLAGFFAEMPALLQALADWFAQRRLPIGGILNTRAQSALGGGMLGLVLVAYLLPYGVSNNIAALQSPYAPMEFPAKDRALITYLKQQNIRCVWTQHWIGQVVMYLENERIVCADYVNYIHKIDILRFPETLQIVAQADRPSFIILYDPALGEPPLATALDVLQVTYTTARFGFCWVITPRSRTVRPSEVFEALEDGYWGTYLAPAKDG